MAEERKRDLEELIAEEIYGRAPRQMEEALGEAEEVKEEAAENAAEAPEENTEGQEEAPAEPELPPETMEDYKDELEASFRQIHAGDVMEGTVVFVDETGAVLDLDFYAPGRIPVEEMSADPHFSILESVHVGDRLTATVTKRDDGAGNILLSRKEADDVLSWDKLEKMKEEGTVVTGKITELVKAGAILYVEGIRGFIPNSRLSLHYVEDNSGYLNQEVSVQVIEVDKEADKLILSARELLAAQAVKEKNERISRITAGNIVEGTVETLKDYGAFVDIGDGITGLLHVSQISDKRIKHPKVVLSEGQKVRVLITKVENGKISLSMKALDNALNRETADEEEQEYSDHGAATTSLADLLKNIRFS